jgi:hypothetical protein
LIDKPTTSEVMDIFNEAYDDAKKIGQDIRDTKKVLSEKLELLSAQVEYMAGQVSLAGEQKGIVEEKIFLADADKVGRYDQFGMTIHPKFVKDPRDLFNFKSTKGYLFKGNVVTKINGEEDLEYTECLKQDTVPSKKYKIKEYDDSNLVLTILPNLKAPLGSLQFNMLEIMPYLPGSFNIESIKVYSRDNLEVETQALEHGIIRVGPQRIIFSGKTELGKIEIRVRLLYKNAAGKYPFGLKHLYVQEADFEDNCYVFVRADKPKAVSYIYDNVVIKNQYGVDTNASSKEYGIHYYAFFDGETPDREMEVSKPASLNYIATNTKTVFIRIPVETSLMAITPNISTETIN